MRFILLLIAVPLLATFAPLSLYRPPPIPERPTLRFEPVALDAERPERRRVGRLRFLEGWEIGSDDPRFGGISAMHVAGREVLALSDAGSAIRFTVPAGRGQVPVAIGPLPGGPGSAANKRDRDSEAMAVAGRRLWVGFERNNSVWRYDRRAWTVEAHARPPAMRRWSANAGSEAMIRFPDGRFLLFSEGKGDDGTSEAVLFDRDPALAGAQALRLRYRPPEGYRITDAALLPGGDLLLLNRRASLMDGISARLVRVAKPRLAAGSVIEGEEIARLAPPLAVDNMEALSVAQEDGRTILWIGSDDNFTAIQRTLLMKFALE